MISDDDILEDLIKTNRRTNGETISKQQYREHGNYNVKTPVRHFGTWNNAKQRAGVYAEERTKQITEEQLLDDLKTVKNQCEELTTETYREHGNHSLMTIYNRLGSFKKARNQV